MPSTSLIDILSHALLIVIITVGMLALPALIVGLILSIIQTATQVNDITLNFLPKFIAVLLTVAFLSPWLFHLLTSYTPTLFEELNFLIR